MPRRRRGRGEGAIYQRADGLWVTTVSLGYTAAGKRRRRTLYGKTKREVQLKLRELQKQVEQGVVADAPSTTLAAYLTAWLAAIKDAASFNTYGYYECQVRVHIIPRIGGTKLAAMTPAVVQGFYNAMAKDGVSVALRKKVGVTLGVAMTEAVNLRLVAYNPVRNVRKPKPPAKEMRSLTTDEVAVFLDATQADRLHALFVAAMDSGARQGELLGLQWHDVDFAAGCIHIRRVLRERNGVLMLAEPKTAQGRRRIDLSRYTMAALGVHRERMLAEGHCRPETHVFCDTHGGWLRKSNFLRRSFYPAMKRAGIKGVTFHGLRHSCASLLLADGERVKTVSERLGHANSAMTLNVYAHVMAGAQAQAAARMDAILRPPDEGRKTA